jgi:membrane-bound metal-dependent hydrolase YbcI (DUF457 family)
MTQQPHQKETTSKKKQQLRLITPFNIWESTFEASPLFAIGHFSIGYLTAKVAATKLNIQLNMPLLLTASIIPDVDLLLRFMGHRGATHSIIGIIALTVPFLIYYRKAAIPYAIALASHSLIGDILVGGIQLFWPFSRRLYGATFISVDSLTSVLAEVILFLVSTAIMYKTKDLQKITTDKHKIALIIPIGAVLVPLLTVGRGLDTSLPTLLIIPSLFYLALFAYSIWVSARKSLKINRI